MLKRDTKKKKRKKRNKKRGSGWMRKEKKVGVKCNMK